MAPEKQFRYANPESIASHLLCEHACRLPLIDPVLHKDCAYLFCKGCIEPLGKCPACEGSVQGKLNDSLPRFIIDTLDALPVVCPVCQQTVPRAQLHIHIQNDPVDCVIGCGEKVAPIKQADHAHVCTAKLVHCEARGVGCPWYEPRRLAASHAAACPYNLLKSHLVEIQQQVTQYRQEAQQKHEELQAKQAEIQQAQQEKQTEIQRIAQQHRAETQRKQDEIQQIHQQHQVETQQLEKRRQAEIQQIQQEHQAERQRSQTEVQVIFQQKQAEIQQMQQKHQAEIQQMQQRQTEAQQIQAEVQRQNQQEIQKLQRHQQEEIDQIIKQKQAEIQQIREQRQNEIDQILKQKQIEIQQIKQEHQILVQQLQPLKPQYYSVGKEAAPQNPDAPSNNSPYAQSFVRPQYVSPPQNLLPATYPSRYTSSYSRKGGD